MSSAVKVPITITGDNVDLTPALTDYVNLKVERTLGKLSSVSAVSHCDVYLTVNKNPKVNISVNSIGVTTTAIDYLEPMRFKLLGNSQYRLVLSTLLFRVG